MSGYCYVGTATYKPNEFYVFFGRTAGDAFQNNIQLFRPFDGESGDWSSLEPNSLFTATLHCMGATESLKGYLFGGTSLEGWANPGSGANRATAAAFTPYETWEGLTTMAAARSHAGAFTIGSTIYICGGYTTTAASDTLSYLPSTDTYSVGIASMAAARYNFAAFAASSFGWAIGGNTGSGVINTVEKFDPAGPSWSTALSGTYTGRDWCRGGATNGNLGAVFGGRINASGFTNQIMKLDPGTPVLTASAVSLIKNGADLPTAGLLDKVYCAGGHGPNDSVFRETTEYDPLTDTVAQKALIEDFRRNGALGLTI